MFGFNKHKGILGPFLQKQRLQIAAQFCSGKILDVGNNGGVLLDYLEKNNVKITSYTGTDLNEFNQVESKNGIPTNYIQGNCETINLKSKFDAIIMLAVIEHLKNPEKAVKNLAKYLKRNGLFVISTPTKIGDAIHHIFSKVYITSRQASHEHEKIFDLNELEKILKDNKLKIITKKYFMFGLNQYIVGRK